ncbi:MAG: hypothetical protein HKP41_11030 [Desulfobacterales bacterium]|nr:hypothetical protein [Deltaproteobacteria bacterium]NNK94872.1 hypothetical protein [Desulfobacterales bacterium]
MKKTLGTLLCCLVLLSMLTHASASKKITVPLSMGGFTLNTPIESYDITRYDNFLKEELVTDIEGFHKGFISYGTCKQPGNIVRIKLKYADKSYKFFEELLKKYNDKFGSKAKYDGDSFGNVKAWKWSFSDENGRRVTLVLQHNLKDADESIGNTVKLSLPDELAAERKCFNKIGYRQQEESKKEESIRDWQTLLPQ